MLDEKDLQAIDALIARRMGAVIEADIVPKFDLLADGQKMILETLAPKSKVEELEEEIAFLKSVIKLHSEDIAKLKKPCKRTPAVTVSLMKKGGPPLYP